MESNNQLNLWNLPSNARIKINDSYRNKFFNSAIEIAGSVTSLSNMLGIKSIRNFYCYRNSEYFTPLKIIRNTLSLFPESERSKIFLKLQQNTEKLKTDSISKPIENPKLPFKFSPLLCRTTGHIIGDGGIFNLNGTYIAHYSNKSRILLNQFKNDIIDIFGYTEIYEFYDKRKNAYRITLPSIVGLLLTIFLGEQNDMSKHIPEKILSKNKKSKALFLRALFDDEGCVNLGKKDGSGRSIEFSISNENIIETIKNMLKEFFIKTGKTYKRKILKSNNLNYKFHITGKSNIKQFKKEIGFDNKDKIKKLNLLIKKYKKK